MQSKLPSSAQLWCSRGGLARTVQVEVSAEDERKTSRRPTFWWMGRVVCKTGRIVSNSPL